MVADVTGDKRKLEPVRHAVAEFEQVEFLLRSSGPGAGIVHNVIPVPVGKIEGTE